MTPFDTASDAVIQAHLSDRGFTVVLGPAFENRKAGAALALSRDELFEMVKTTFRERPTEAIYFQGATMDPLPILQRLEDALSVPVITSNSAMLWNLLTRMGHSFSIDGYGRLLKEWPGQSERASQRG
jgi:maleate cis-trans isomerase